MTSEEKMKVLKMIEEGKISAEEGAKILEAIEEGGMDTEQIPLPKEGRILKIKVSDRYSGAVKINLSLPLGIARFIKSFIPPAERAKLEDRGIDMEAILANLDSGTVGKLVEVEDENDNQRIEIWIE